MSVNSFFKFLYDRCYTPLRNGGALASISEDTQQCVDAEPGARIDELPVEVASHILQYVEGSSMFSYGMVSDAARIQVLLYSDHKSKKSLNGLRLQAEKISKAISVLKILLEKDDSLLSILGSVDDEILGAALRGLPKVTIKDIPFLVALLLTSDPDEIIEIILQTSSAEFVRAVFRVLFLLERLTFLLKLEFSRENRNYNATIMTNIRSSLIPLVNCIGGFFYWKLGDGNVSNLLEISADSFKDLCEERFLERVPEEVGQENDVFLERLIHLIPLGISFDSFLLLTRVSGISIPKIHPGLIERMLRSCMTRVDFMRSILSIPFKLDPVLVEDEIYRGAPLYSCLDVCLISNRGDTERQRMIEESSHEMLISRPECRLQIQGFSSLFIAAIIDNKKTVKYFIESGVSSRELVLPSRSHLSSVLLNKNGVSVPFFFDVFMRGYLKRLADVFPDNFALDAFGHIDLPFLCSCSFISLFRNLVLNCDLFAVKNFIRMGMSDPLEKPYTVGNLSVTALADLCFPTTHFRPYVTNDEVNNMALLLVQKGANVNAVITEGITILMLACGLSGNHSKCRFVEILLSYGANVYAADVRGNTALHCLAQVSPEEDLKEEYGNIFKLLLTHGAFLESRNHAGQTPADVARMFNNIFFLNLESSVVGSAV